MSDYNFYNDTDESQSTSEPLTGYMLSLAVGAALFVFTAIEYVIATTDDLPVFSSNVLPLVVIAIVKAALIVNYYMHISSIWTTEEDGH